MNYLIKSEHSLATHGHPMMMVVAKAVADYFHFGFAAAKKSNSYIISKYCMRKLDNAVYRRRGGTLQIVRKCRTIGV